VGTQYISEKSYLRAESAASTLPVNCRYYGVRIGPGADILARWNAAINGNRNVLIPGSRWVRVITRPSRAITPNRSSCCVRIEIVVEFDTAFEHPTGIEGRGTSLVELDRRVSIVSTIEDNASSRVKWRCIKYIVRAKTDGGSADRTRSHGRTTCQRGNHQHYANKEEELFQPHVLYHHRTTQRSVERLRTGMSEAGTSIVNRHVVSSYSSIAA